MDYVWRRSALSLSTLVGLFVIIGAVVVQLTSVSPLVPLVVGLVVVAMQYLIGPWLISLLIPAVELSRTDSGYAADDSLARIVERQAQAAGVPLPRVGIIDDGTPNAFTFGRTQRDARLYVSRGLLERLDERELDAVVAHEIGHIKNHDFIVMTVATVIPMVLYYVYLLSRGNNRADGAVISIVSFVGYLLAQLAVLALSRARELGADHASCAATQDGDALCSALVKIAYGIGQVDRERQSAVRALLAQKRRKEARRLQRQGHRVASVRALGIANDRVDRGMLDAREAGASLQDSVAAMRWDAINPWGRFSEKLATHPLVVRRIAALENSGLPGAPREWNATALLEQSDGPEVSAARDRFWVELPLRYAGWLAFAAAVVSAETWHDAQAAGVLAVAAGVLLFLRAMLRTPLTEFTPVDRVTTLLGRLDASPMRGIPVSIRGRVLGRGMPGYVLSADLVVADESGFVPVLYTNQMPFTRTFFALLRAGKFADSEVVARGWYRRETGPYVELRHIVPATGRRARCRQYLINYVFAVLCAVIGVLVVLAHMN